MNRLCTLFAIAVGAAIPGAAGAQYYTQNVLIIVADDLGIDKVESYCPDQRSLNPTRDPPTSPHRERSSKRSPSRPCSKKRGCRTCPPPSRC